MSDLFISYSRTDQDFVRRLHEALATRGKDAWVDWEDIPAAARWLDELRGAIESTDSFVFVISPDSIVSDVCLQEAAHAQGSGKRVIPIVRREVNASLVPEGIAAHNWINLREGDDFETGIDTLVRALETDLDWVHDHTRLLTRAVEWDRANRDSSFLLRGRDLEAAEARLSVGTEGRDPRPTALQVEYAIASRRSATRGQRIRLGALSIGLCVALALTVFSLVQLNDALHQRQLADAATTRAEDEARVAERQTRVAQDQTGIANSRELAQAAIAQLDTDPELSILLAMRALEASRTQEADHALRAAIQASQVRRTIESGTSADAIALSPDGRRLISVTADGTTFLTDLTAAGAIPRRLAQTAAANGVTFAPGGERAASALVDGTVAVWDLRSGGPPILLRTAMPLVWAVSFDDTGSRLAAVGPAGALEIWDVAGRALVRSIQSGELDLYGVAFSADGALVAAAGQDFAVRIWNVLSGVAVSTLEGHTAAVFAVAFSTDGRQLVSGGADTIPRVWSVATGSIVAELHGHTADVIHVAFNGDGTRILSAADDGTARLWDAASGAAIAVLRGNRSAIAVARFGPGRGEVVTVGSDGTLRVWAETPEGPIASTRGHIGEVLQVEFDLSGERIVTAGTDGTARVWDRTTGRLVTTLRGHLGGVTAAAFSPDGRRVATASDDGSVRLWDPTTGLQRALVGENLDAIWGVAFSPDSRRLAEAGNSGMRVFDVESGRQVLFLPKPLASVRFNPAGDRVVVSDTGGLTADVYDVRSGEHQLVLSGHTFSVNDASFNSTGDRIVTAGGDGTARIWDAATGASLLEICAVGNAGGIFSALFSPDGTRVVTGQDDGTADVWDTETGELLAVYHADSTRVDWAAFSPDGQRIAAAGVDGTARIFECDVCGSTDQVIALASTRITRDLSQDERILYLHEPAPSQAPAAAPSVQPVPSIQPSPTEEPTASPASSAAPSTAPIAAPSDDPRGADLCAGPGVSCDLTAGRYHPTRFRPSLSLVVGAGWQNAIYQVAVISVARPADGAELDIVSGATAGLLGGRVVAIPPGRDGFVSTVRSHPELLVTNLTQTRIDGLDATRIDVANPSDHQVNYLQQDGVTFLLAPGERDRFVLVDVRGTTVVIAEVVSDGTTFSASQRVLQEVVDTIRFE